MLVSSIFFFFSFLSRPLTFLCLLFDDKKDINIFIKCVESFWSNDESRQHMGSHEFDKDNSNALDFVVASSNLRAHCFGIPLQSTFSVKQIAGNIVHAIATTNAMAAGLELIELMKVVRRRVLRWGTDTNCC